MCEQLIHVVLVVGESASDWEQCLSAQHTDAKTHLYACEEGGHGITMPVLRNVSLRLIKYETLAQQQQFKTIKLLNK